MRNMYLLMTLAGFSFIGPAQADQAGWCAAYARDFADARATDKSLWQHKYDIAQKACLDDQKQSDAVPAMKKAEASPTPAKPVAVAAPITEQKAAIAKATEIKTADKKIADAKIADVKPADKKVADNTKSSSGAPEPGSSAWNAYCAKKYSSFDEKTGTYQSYTGVARKCIYTG